MSGISTNFGRSFIPDHYIRDYYAQPDDDLIKSWVHGGSRETNVYTAKDATQENAYLLIFYAEVILPLLKEQGLSGRRLLEVGGGPTIYQLISLATVVESIWFTDYAEQNLEYVRNWKRGGGDLWQDFVKASLALETRQVAIPEAEIRQRISLVKGKLDSLFTYDVIADESADGLLDTATFDIVCSNFCLESITNSQTIWGIALRNLCRKVKPGGRVVINALQGAHSYSVGQKRFPATPITQAVLVESLEKLAFGNIIIRSLTSDYQPRSYPGMIFATAVKQ